MAFKTFQWNNECNMARQVASYLGMDQITTLTAHMASLTHQLAVANLRESHSTCGSYVPMSQAEVEVQFANNWGNSNYHGNNLAIQYYLGLSDHENLFSKNPWNATNYAACSQPQEVEKESSLEDLIGTFITESRTRLSRNEARMDNLETTVENISASVKSLETQIGQIANSVNNQNKVEFPSNIDLLLDWDDDATNDEGVQYPLECYNENPTSQDIVDIGGTMEYVLALEQLPNEKVSNKGEPTDEKPQVEGVRATVELEQLPKSLRYANFGTGLFCPMISSSSFTGLQEGKPWQHQDHEVKSNILKEMTQHNENDVCFKIDTVDEITEDLSEKHKNHSESIEYVDQRGASEKFQMLRPRFKEPEHRKAKIHGKDGRS